MGDVASVSISTPLWKFPEIMFRAPDVNPRTVLLEAAKIITPCLLLNRAAVPLASVPMKLPCTRLKDAIALIRATPLDIVVPEITFRALAVVPPIVLDGPRIATEVRVLPKARVPATLGPIKLFCTRFDVALMAGNA